MKVKRTVYGEGGFDPSKPNDNIVEEREVSVPDEQPPTVAELLEAMDPAKAKAILEAAGGFVNRAGDLWNAFVEMDPTDQAHDAIGIVTDIALTAALPLIEAG